MSNKIKVGILFGGRSTEHEVSLRSATNIFKAIDKEKYEITLIGIDKQGQWHLNDGVEAMLSNQEQLKIANKLEENILLVQRDNVTQLISPTNPDFKQPLDVIFPVLHGSYGEDGTIQGFLKLMDMPYVGPDILGSSVAMDKDVAKRLMRDAGIPIADFFVLYKWADDNPTYEDIEARFGLPFFVKPANAGSSVGVSKIKSKAEYAAKLAHAFEFDHKVLVEEAILGKELECAVLGNEKPLASGVGEIIPQAEFYSYEAKYLTDDGAIVQIPAEIPSEIVEKVRQISIKTFQVLCLEGLSRVDFLYGTNGKLAVNEVNTLPGFTSISMYPQLWQQEGMSYSTLIDHLIQYAIARHQRDAQLKTSI